MTPEGAALRGAFRARMERLGPWARDRAVAVAVSGGADSLALALLVAEWARGGAAPLGLVVDHGLRAGSDAVAARAAARIASLGLRAAVLRADGLDAGGGGLQTRARDARSALLARACAEAGLVDLLLGHHAADQAETLDMRRRRGTGPAGAAGMAPVAERGGLRLVRPLLDLDRDALRRLLSAAGIEWDEDPANADPRFERVRLRGSGAPPGSPPPPRGPDPAARRRRHEAAVAAWAAGSVSLHEAGFAVLAPGPIPPDGLAALLRTLSGDPHPPPRDAVRRLAAAPRPATLHGVRLAVAPRRFGGGWLVFREEAAMAPAAPLDRIWDRRYRAARPAGGTAGRLEGWTLGAVGADAPAIRRAIRRAVPAPRGLPAALARTLPCLRDGRGRPVAVPHLGWRAADPTGEGGELRVTFCPTVPLASQFFTF